MCKSLLAYICPPGLTFILLALLSAGVVGRASAQIAFTDVSIAAGLGSSASETWGDVNGDLYPDVFFSNHRTRATLYRNRRDGTFAEVSQQVDVSRSPGWTGGAATVDTHGATWGTSTTMATMTWCRR